jgi:abortive infection bacteriophage resistance protein
MKYEKPALSLDALLSRWQMKGLVVPDLDAARRALTFIGYFHLRGYALPLMHANILISAQQKWAFRTPGKMSPYGTERK